MTIAECIGLAFRAHDPRAASVAAEALRARGLTYQESFELVQRVHPAATLAEWDALLAESDEE